MKRDIHPILPHQFSKSYRLFIKNDFSDVSDFHSIVDWTYGQEKKGELFLSTLRNIIMTRAAIEDDLKSTGFTNWTEIGCIFNNFTHELFKELESDVLF